MPLFEYKCTNCGKISEFLLKSGSAPTDGCKHCGEKRIEKVTFSKFSVGSGASGPACDFGNCDAREGCLCSEGCKHR